MALCWMGQHEAACQLPVYQGSFLLAQHWQDTPSAGQEDNSNPGPWLCHLTFGQWQRAVVQPSQDPPVQAAMGAECGCLPGVPDWSIRPRHPGLTWTALAASQTEGGLQGAAADLQSTRLHGLAPPYLVDLVLVPAHTVTAVQLLPATNRATHLTVDLW